jgi:hypothetical protein
MNWLERARREIEGTPFGTTANSAERIPTAVMAVRIVPSAAQSAASIGSNGSAPPRPRHDSEATLEVERLATRRIVQCRGCAHYIPSPPIQRASGAVWETPGGCTKGKTSPDARPPIYPFTGWHCDGWATRKLQ